MERVREDERERRRACRDNEHAALEAGWRTGRETLVTINKNTTGWMGSEDGL
jgi:hypothetical protein